MILQTRYNGYCSWEIPPELYSIYNIIGARTWYRLPYRLYFKLQYIFNDEHTTKNKPANQQHKIYLFVLFFTDREKYYTLYEQASMQRWASTLANRSNARHRSKIRAPPTPPPPRFMYPKCGNLCGQRGRKRFITSWGLRMSHICPCTPCPSTEGSRSKVESRHFAHHC